MTNEEAAPKYHPSFTKGDIIIVANDGTHFAAKCERLAQGSQVFKDLLDLLKTEWDVNNDGMKSLDVSVTSHEKTFDIDASSTLTGYFLSFLGTDIPLLPPISFKDTLKLLDLCNKFECTEAHMTLVGERLSSESTGRLRELLYKAPDLRDIELANMTLRRWDFENFINGREPGGPGGYSLHMRLSGLCWAWQGRLLSLLTKSEKVKAPRKVAVIRVPTRGNWVRDYESYFVQIPALTFVDANYWSHICNEFASTKW